MSNNGNGKNGDAAGPADVLDVSDAVVERARDVLAGLAWTSAIVADVAAGGDWPDDVSRRFCHLQTIMVNASSVVELAAGLVTGDTRRRLLAAVSVLDAAPFGPGSHGDGVDLADVGGTERRDVPALA